MNVLHIDFETRSEIDLTQVGADVYACHPSTEILCLGYAFNNAEPQIVTTGLLPEAVEKHVKGGGKVVAHNAAFEWLIWNNCTDWPKLLVSQLDCTMARAFSMGLPGALDKAAPALGVKHGKDMRGHRVMLQLSKPRKTKENEETQWWEDEEKFKELHRYCAQDIRVEREVFKRTRKLSPSERELWELDFTINRRGVRIDTGAIRTAIGIVERETQRLDAEIREASDNCIPSTRAVADIKRYLLSRGISLDGVAKADLAEIKTTDAKAKKVIKLRQEAAKTSTAKLKKMLALVGSHDRCRGLFQYHGASTGRWAGRGVQPQNMPRPALSQKEVKEVFEVLNGD